jgi:gluconate 2-dehydrogenase gamma chain
MPNMSPVDRRSLLQRALFLVGGALAPGVSLPALAAGTDAAARLLDARRFELLSAVAETMVPRTDTPGAIEAGVPARFDGLLRNWASPERRRELIDALDAIDGKARQAEQSGFAKLTPGKRQALLAAHDASALKAPPAAPPEAGPLPSVADPMAGEAPKLTNALMAGGPVTDPAYAKLKELIVVLYYYSETALTHELPYDHTPGEWVPSMPIGPTTRSSGGASLF